ncbi:hypothetical protein PCL_11339 [Purpureocillium lilacinum]|uniref:Uncharacterized protein n=1 Tax=Purpureocillium lilacinum TaxID=33203 RepID=A0A2U3DPR3_PURLI|nr:hypothetical protein PCL_11339 [Purpureocillium lilacinum]
MCQDRVCYGDLLVKICIMSAIAIVDSYSTVDGTNPCDCTSDSTSVSGMSGTGRPRQHDGIRRRPSDLRPDLNVHGPGRRSGHRYSAMIRKAELAVTMQPRGEADMYSSCHSRCKNWTGQIPTAASTLQLHLLTNRGAARRSDKKPPISRGSMPREEDCLCMSNLGRWMFDGDVKDCTTHDPGTLHTNKLQISEQPATNWTSL